MDVLDPLSESAEGEIEESKIFITNIKQNAMDSDDEQASVEHLAPQTLLETPDSDVQYSVRSSEGSMITYRVLQVEDGVDSPQYVSTSSFSSATTIPQVISGTNINGPIYVIGNPDAYTTTTTTGTRAIAPRPSVLDNSVVVQVKKRDEKRRATHNEVERRRRDKINNWIAKLAKIIPDGPQDIKGNGQYDGHSKGGILSKAFEYIVELQATETRLHSCLKENRKLAHSIEQIKLINNALETENKELRELLKKHGLDVVNKRPS